MKTANYNTLSDQVAQTLENEIYCGLFPPNSLLPSTRTLAKRFFVSQRVILAALDNLEKKDILVRQERRGVYVKSRCATANAHEILFFAFGEALQLHTIYQAVNDLILNHSHENAFDFFCRIISSEQIVTPQRLDRELARLQNLGFIDCAICYSSLIASADNMAKFMTLPYPVVFLGELPDRGKLPTNAHLLSLNSNELLTTAANYAIHQKDKLLIFAFWQPEAQRNYEKQAMDAMKLMLTRHDVDYLPVPVPGKNFKEASQNFKNMADKLIRQTDEPTLLVTQNIHCDEFDEGKLFPRQQFPNLQLMTLNLPRNPGAVTFLKRDVKPFQDALKTIVQKLLENPKEPGKHLTVPIQYHIVKGRQ